MKALSFFSDFFILKFTGRVSLARPHSLFFFEEGFLVGFLGPNKTKGQEELEEFLFSLCRRDSVMPLDSRLDSTPEELSQECKQFRLSFETWGQLLKDIEKVAATFPAEVLSGQYALIVEEEFLRKGKAIDRQEMSVLCALVKNPLLPHAFKDLLKEFSRTRVLLLITKLRQKKALNLRQVSQQGVLL